MGKKKYEEYMRNLNRNPIEEKQKDTRNLPVIDSEEEQISILIEEIKSDFIQGKITKKEIPNIERQLAKYDLTKDSVIVLAEIYEKIYDNKPLAMETLGRFMENAINLKREDFVDIQKEMDRIGTMMEIDEDIMAKYAEQKYVEEKLAEEKRNERKMIQELVEHLKQGNISEEQVESTVGDLKRIKDRTRAIFLIGKLNEVCKGPEEAKTALKYMSHIKDLSEYEKEMIKDYQTKLQQNEPSGGTKKAIKNFTKKEKERRKFKKSENDAKTKRLLQLGFTVREILEDAETSISVKHIFKIRKELVEEDPEYRKKLEEKKQKIQEEVIYLYKEGKTNSKIYEKIEYEVSKKEIKSVIEDYEKYCTWGDR